MAFSPGMRVQKSDMKHFGTSADLVRRALQRGAGRIAPLLVLLLLQLLPLRAASSEEDSWLSRKLQDFLLVDPSGGVMQPDSLTAPVSTLRPEWQGYAGRRIGRILVLDADSLTAAPQDQWYERPFRPSVKESRMLNNVLFREGDRVNPMQLADSERLLRALEDVEYARIVLAPSDANPREVIVYILVREAIPFALELRVHKLKSVGLVFNDKNIGGRGLDISAGIYLQRTYKQQVGYTFSIGYENLWHTFIAPSLYYSDRKNLVSYGASVKKNFETSETKYAGHILVERNLRTITGYYQGLLLVEEDEDPFVLHYHNFDVWLGRSVALPTGSRRPDMRRNLTFGLRSNGLIYERRPDEMEHRYYSLLDQHYVLMSVHLAQQAYRQTSRIYNYGRTEDIPEGWSLELAGGRNFDELLARNYAGMKWSSGKFLRHDAYVHLDAGYGCFIGDGRMTQATVYGDLRYFTGLYNLGAGNGRTFVSATYRHALKTVTDDYLTLNRVGIEGVRSDSIRGKQRLICQLESDFFTPWRIKGFQTVLFAFGDVGWITPHSQRPVSGHTYASVGFGLRMRNEHLVFSTVQIRFAYMINRPEDISFEAVEMSDDKRLRVKSFEAKAPDVILLNN